MNTFEMVVLKHVVKDKYHDKQTEAENKIVWSFHSKSKKKSDESRAICIQTALSEVEEVGCGI